MKKQKVSILTGISPHVLWVRSLIACLGCLILGCPTLACTNFFIKAKDGSIVTGRSMEFGNDLASRLDRVPREKQFSSPGINGASGTEWKNRWGFVAISHGNQRVYSSGINEKGLVADALWFADVNYPTPNPGDNALRNWDVVGWILGNFATVDEVQQALKKVSIYLSRFQPLDIEPPLHWCVTDVQGKSIVIEHVDGKLMITDNVKNGVLTNDPHIGFHLTNLRTYSHINPLSKPDPRLQIPNWAQGGEMKGLPGDFSSPSRFVRISALKFFANPSDNAEQAVNMAFHLLNTVDYPIGVDVYPGQRGNNEKQYTPWITVFDQTHGYFYYRTSDSLNIFRIDLKQLDFAPNQPIKSIPIYGNLKYIDDTERMVKSN